MANPVNPDEASPSRTPFYSSIAKDFLMMSLQVKLALNTLIIFSIAVLVSACEPTEGEILKVDLKASDLTLSKDSIVNVKFAGYEQGMTADEAISSLKENGFSVESKPYLESIYGITNNKVNISYAMIPDWVIIKGNQQTRGQATNLSDDKATFETYGIIIGNTLVKARIHYKFSELLQEGPSWNEIGRRIANDFGTESWDKLPNNLEGGQTTISYTVPSADGFAVGEVDITVQQCISPRLMKEGFTAEPSPYEGAHYDNRVCELNIEYEDADNNRNAQQLVRQLAIDQYEKKFGALYCSEHRCSSDEINTMRKIGDMMSARNNIPHGN